MSDRRDSQPRAESWERRPIARGAERKGARPPAVRWRAGCRAARPGPARPPRAARPRGRGPQAAAPQAAARGDRTPQRGALSKCRPRQRAVALAAGGGAGRASETRLPPGRGAAAAARWDAGSCGRARTVPSCRAAGAGGGCRGRSAAGKGGRRRPTLCSTPSPSWVPRRGPPGPGGALQVGGGSTAVGSRLRAPGLTRHGQPG